MTRNITVNIGNCLGSGKCSGKSNGGVSSAELTSIENRLSVLEIKQDKDNQTLSFDDGTLSITNGNSVKLDFVTQSQLTKAENDLEGNTIARVNSLKERLDNLEKYKEGFNLPEIVDKYVVTLHTLTKEEYDSELEPNEANGIYKIPDREYFKSYGDYVAYQEYFKEFYRAGMAKEPLPKYNKDWFTEKGLANYFELVPQENSSPAPITRLTFEDDTLVAYHETHIDPPVTVT